MKGGAVKMSAIAGIACSQLHKLQEEATNHEQILKGYFKWETHGFILGFLAQYNEYYPMPEKWGNVAERCAGIETREPQHWSDKNRMIWTYELNPKMINMEQLCDSDIQVIETDPRYLYKENDPNRQATVEKDIQTFEDFEALLVEK